MSYSKKTSLNIVFTKINEGKYSCSQSGFNFGYLINYGNSDWNLTQISSGTSFNVNHLTQILNKIKELNAE